MPGRGTCLGDWEQEKPGLIFLRRLQLIIDMEAPLSARVEMRGHRPLLLINGEIVSPLLYGLTDCPGSRWSWEEVPARNIRIFGEKGISLFQVDLWLEQMVDERGGFDLSLACRQIAGVIAAAPGCGVMLRLHLNAPEWWCRCHPDACVGYADTEPDRGTRWGLFRPLAGDREHPLRASFFSTDWSRWAIAHLERFCRDLSETAEGASVMGIQLCNGVFGEWHQFGFLEHDPDTGPAAHSAFLEFLKKRYSTVTRLNEVWGRPIADWSEIGMPSSADREIAGEGSLRDPAQQRWVIDYFEFLHSGTARVIIELAATVKRSWPRNIVTAVFYGYFHGMFGRMAAGGHLALESIFSAREIDCLCGPQSYRKEARAMGGTGHSRGLLGPVIRAGKLWLDEVDEPTSHTECSWDAGFTGSIEDDIALMRRDVLHPVTRGGGMWWYDFGSNARTPDAAVYGVTGAWDHPELMSEVANLARIVSERLRAQYDRKADVLVVHDVSAFCHTVGRRINSTCRTLGDKVEDCVDPLSAHAIDSLTEGLLRSSLIHDEILLSEFEAHSLSDYRLIFFATTPVLTSDQRVVFREKMSLFRGHVVLLSLFGWCDEERMGGFSPMLAHGDCPKQRIELDGVLEEQDLEAGIPAISVGAEVSIIGRWAGMEASRQDSGARTLWCGGIFRLRRGPRRF